MNMSLSLPISEMSPKTSVCLLHSQAGSLCPKIGKFVGEVFESFRDKGSLPSEAELLSARHLQLLPSQERELFCTAYADAVKCYKIFTPRQLSTNSYYFIFRSHLKQIQQILQGASGALSKRERDPYEGLAEKDLASKFNASTLDQATIRTSVIQRIGKIRDSVFSDPTTVNDPEIGKFRLALLQLYACKDPKIKEYALVTLIDILEADPLTTYSSYLLVKLQKKLIKMIRQGTVSSGSSHSESEGVTDLYPVLQHLLVKAYALTLECILLQMFLPNPNIGKIQQSLKEDVWTGISSLKEFLEDSSLEICFWLEYAHQAVQRTKTEESKIAGALGRVWNLVKVGFSIARAINSPEDADKELEEAYKGFKDAFSFIGIKRDWFEDLLIIRKLSRISLVNPALFAHLVDFIQKKMLQNRKGKFLDKMKTPDESDLEMEEKLTLGIIFDLENVMLRVKQPQIQELAFKLLLQFFTVENKKIRSSILSIMIKMAGSTDEALKHTAVILLRFFEALGKVETRMLPSVAFDKQILADLQKKISTSTNSKETVKADYFPHVIHFFLQRVAEIKRIGSRSESIANLLAASSDGEVVQAIIQCIGEIFPVLLDPDFEGRNLFHRAVEHNNAALVRFLGNSGMGININQKEYLYGNTPLHQAVMQGSHAMVQALLESGADPNQKNNDDKTPLHLAVGCEYKAKIDGEIPNSLLQYKAFLSSRDKEGNTPLNLAIEQGFLPVIDLLLNRGAVVKEGIYGQTLLEVACCVKAGKISREREFVVQFLIEKKLLKKEPFTPFEAIYLMKFLFSNGKDLACSPEFAEFHKEKIRKSKAYAQAFSLVEEGPGHMQKVFGLTALHLAAIKGNVEEITHLLAAEGNIESADCLGMTPLHVASLLMQNDAIACLLEQGANPNAVNRFKDTPFLLYCGHESSRAIITLDPEDFSKKGSRKEGILRLFLKKGADCRAVDAENNTCLHHAVFGKSKAIIQGLLELCPRLLLEKNGNDLTPLDLAVNQGSTRVINALLSSFDSKKLVNFSKKYERTKGQRLPLPHILARKGESALFQTLLQGNISLAFSLDGSNKQELPLHKAVIGGHVDILETYVRLARRNQIDLYARDGFGNTIAHLAALFGKAAILQKLKDIGFSFNLRNENRRLAVHIAAMKADIKLMELCGIRQCYQEADGHGDLPIHIATRSGSLKAVEFLYDLYPGSMVMGDENGNTPAHIAAALGYLEIVEFFIGKGYRAEDPNTSSDTLLHLASQGGKSAVIKYLIERHVDLRAQDFEGETPLHKAVFHHHDAAVELLLSHSQPFAGIPLSRIQDIRKETPLHEILKKAPMSKEEEERQERVLVSLISHGADILEENENGQNFLHICCLQGNLRILQLLKSLRDEKKAKLKLDFNKTDYKGNNCVMYAVEKGTPALISFLIGEKGSINHKNNEGITPLMRAIYFRNFSCFRVLMDAGASLLALDEERKNLLHHFFSLKYPIGDEGKSLLLEVVIRHPGLLKKKDGKKYTALHVLAKHGHDDCLDTVLHNLPKKMGKEKMSVYLWSESCGKTPKKIAEEAMLNPENTSDECKRYEKLIQKINHYKIEDLGKNRR